MRTGPKTREPIERFHEKYTVDDSGCWIWHSSSNGRYPIFYLGKGRGAGSGYAHRWSYEHFIGPIPDGNEIDHLCCVSKCVNPAHLEAVSGRENKRRVGERRTHCPSGHLYDDENTRWYRGHKRCKECDRLSKRKKPEHIDRLIFEHGLEVLDEPVPPF